MTDRERLICLLSEYDFDSTFCNICKRPDDDCAVCGSERLADYLISNGVVVLPCKVGDTVYVVYDDDYEEYIVKEIYCGTLGSFRAYAECNIHGYNNIFQCGEKYCGHSACKTSFELREVGKTVFLTGEEAEKALKENKRDEN